MNLLCTFKIAQKICKNECAKRFFLCYFVCARSLYPYLRRGADDTVRLVDRDDLALLLDPLDLTWRASPGARDL